MNEPVVFDGLVHSIEGKKEKGIILSFRVSPEQRKELREISKMSGRVYVIVMTEEDYMGQIIGMEC